MPRPDTRLHFAEAVELLAEEGAVWAAIARDPRRGPCSQRKRLTRRPLLGALLLAECPGEPGDPVDAAHDRAIQRGSVREPKRPGKYTLFGWREKGQELPIARQRFRVRRG